MRVLSEIRTASGFIDRRDWMVGCRATGGRIGVAETRFGVQHPTHFAQFVRRVGWSNRLQEGVSLTRVGRSNRTQLGVIRKPWFSNCIGNRKGK